MPIMRKPEECIVHMSTIEPVPFAQTFVTIAPILVEGSLHFTKDGLFIKGVNNIILCDMVIDNVEAYCCVEDTQVYVNLNSVCGCISAVTQDEVIVFQITKESMSAGIPFLAVFIVNRNDGYVFSFEVPQLALEYDDFEVPKTNFEHVISIPSDKFQRVLRTCARSARGQYVQICTRNQGPDDTYIVFNTVGDDSSMMFYMRYQIAESEWKEGSCNKQDLYSLKYLMLIAKGAPVSNCVTLYLAPEFVLAVAYNIGTIGKITFCLAPRMETSDFLPPQITPLDSVIPAIEGDMELDGMDVLMHEESDGNEGSDAESVVAPKRSKKKQKKKKQRVVEGGGAVTDLADISAVNTKTKKSKRKKDGDVASVGVRMASKEDEATAKKKRKALMNAKQKDSSMRMHDDGSKIKRRRRKKPEQDDVKTSGAGSIKDAFMRSGQSKVADSLQMSASNMTDVERGATVNSALMGAAKKTKTEDGPLDLEELLQLPESV